MGFDNSPIRFWDFTFFLIFIILITRDSFYFLFSNDTRTLLFLFIYIYFLGRIFFHIVYKKDFFNCTKGIPVILTLIVISSLWSGNILYSLKLSILQLILSSVVVIFITNKYKIETIMKITFCAGSLMALSSYITVFAFPSIGVMTESFIGLWRGIFTHKNLLAVNGALHLIIAIFLLLFEKRNLIKLGYLIIGIMQLLLIVFSGASTGIVTLILLIIIIFLLTLIFKINNKYLLISILTFMTLFTGVIVYILINLIENIVFAFDKDLTFSGRTYIWAAVINLIKEKFFWGYGYGSFWREGSLTFNYVNQYVPWNDEHFQSHNGFLDIVTNIGFVGLIIILVMIYFYIKRNLSLLIRLREKLYFLPLIYIIFFIIYNLQESFLIEQNFIMWSLFVCFYTFLSLKTKVVNKKP